MNVKKFSILTAVIVGIMIITTIVLSCITVNVPVSQLPDQFIVYNKSASGTTYDPDQRPSKYNDLCKLYKQMTKLSVFDYMIKGKSLSKMPSQDINEENGNWTDNNKSNYICLELVFDEEQNVVVKIGEDTRAIKFTALIMKVTKGITCHEVAVYFSVSTSSYKSYQTKPILVNAKQNKLYKYINSLAD